MKQKILNISSIDYSGAGKFTTNFNDLLLMAGYESVLVVRDVKTDYPHLISYPQIRYEKPIAKIQRRLYKKKWSDMNLNYDYYFYNICERITTISASKILSLTSFVPDIIFIHWVTDFVNAKILYELQKLTNAKIFIFMLDNAPITGGCHYPWNCEGYQHTCNNCPAIINSDEKWLAQKNLTFKRTHLPQELTLLVFSQNDFDRAKQSTLYANKKILKMPGYFIDESKYCQGDQNTAKSYFEIPLNHKVIFFGATSLKEKRKGADLFTEALTCVTDEDVTLIIAGSLTLPFQFKNLKVVGDLNEEQLIIAYQAADVFVCPTLEDSGPTMINQSILCGTPVVSFETGIGGDLVHTDETGYRAIFGNFQDLAHGINYILSLSIIDRHTMAKKCRDYALNQYGGRDSYVQKLAELMAI